MRAQLEAQAAALTDRLAAGRRCVSQPAIWRTVQVELTAAQPRAERGEASVLARRLLAEFGVAPRERDDGSGRRRKASG